MTTRYPERRTEHPRQAPHPSLRSPRAAIGKTEALNAKIANSITKMVGTMWCAYIFTVIALIGLPAALKPGGEGIVAWIAQTFLQLVLLSVIMVGQNVQTRAADERSKSTFKDTEAILDRLDLRTEGGLKTILDKLDEVVQRMN